MPPVVAHVAKVSAPDRIRKEIIRKNLWLTSLMTDHFAVLGEPRRPWLDPEVLKAKFLVLSADAHPDRVHHASEEQKEISTRRYLELNAAYNCLRDPKERLFHLLALERGVKPEPVQPIDPETINLFNEVSQICRKADTFLADKARSTSPLLKAQILLRATELTEVIRTLRDKILTQRDMLTERVKMLNAAWESAPRVGTPSRISFLPCEQLEQVYRHLSYVSRLSAQIEERLVQLSI